MIESKKLQELLAGVLGEFNPGKSLIDQGLDSFGAVRVQRGIANQFDVDVPLSEFLRDAPAAELVDTISRTVGGAAPSRESPARAEAAPGPVDRDSSPLTPVQATYWVGRHGDYPLGGISTRFYLEFDLLHDGDRTAFVGHLEEAWNRVVDRHEMLRAIVGRDGLQRLPEECGVHRIMASDEPTEAIRERLARRVPDLEQWPVHDVEVGVIDDRTVRVHVGFEVVLIDFPGIVRVLDDWGRALEGVDLGEETTTFPEIVNGLPGAPAPADLAHWEKKAPQLHPGPLTDDQVDVDAARPPRFHRHEATIPAPEWAKFRDNARAHGASPSGALLAVAAHALRCSGTRERFSLGATFFSPDGTGDAPVGDYTRTGVVDAGEPGGAMGPRAAAATRELWDALEHATVTSADIMRMRAAAASEEGAPADDAAALPEFPVVFTSAISHGGGPAHWPGIPRWGVSQTPQVLADLLHWERDGDLVLAWDCVDAALPEGFGDRALGVAVAVIRALADDAAWDDAALAADPWFRHPDEVQRPRSVTAGDPAIDALLRERAGAAPEATAVIDAEGTWSRAELDLCADAVAAAVSTAARDIGEYRAGAPVLVQMGKSRDQIAAVTGIVRAGLAYIPVDPSWPSRRVAAVAARSGAKLCIADDGVEVAEGVARIDLGKENLGSGDVGMEKPGGAGGSASDDAADRIEPGPEDLAYVIFTSGSTGEPKGVAIEHDQARTTIDDVNVRFGLADSDVVLGLSALSFDLSVWDIFGVLGAGGALLLPDGEKLRDPSHWLELCSRHRVSVWNSAPPLLEMLVEYAEIDPEPAKKALRHLRLVMLSGDWIPVTLARRLWELAPNARVYSLGGATEAAIWSIHHPVAPGDEFQPSIPYGTALGGQWFRILDDDGEPAPIGVPGHLHIGGAGVARGYIGDPGRTAERFRVHPRTGERLYDTGDMGEWLPNGEIRFLGRVDRQVKINGFRIELGEVDAALSRCASVRAAVSAAPEDTSGRKRLISHVVPTDPESFDDGALRAELGRLLPTYMIPSRFMVHDRLPVTANGKIDHKALPNPWEKGAAAPAAPDILDIPGIPAAPSAPVGPAPAVAGTPADILPSALVPAAAAEPAPAADDHGDLTPTQLGIGSLELVRMANVIEDRTGQRPPLAQLLSRPWRCTLEAAGLVDEEPAVPAPAPARSNVGETEESGGGVVAEEPPEGDLLAAGVAAGGRFRAEFPRTGEHLEEQFLRVGHWLRSLRASIADDVDVVAAPGTGETLCTVELSAGIVAPAVPKLDLSPAPLTPLQLGYLVGRADEWLVDPVTPHYYTEVAMESLDVAALRAALDKVVAAHPALSLTVRADGSQIIDPACRPHVAYRDFRGSADPEHDLAAVRADGRRGIADPFGEPWLRLAVSRLDDGWRLHMSIDMLFCDVIGARVLAEDLLRAYRGERLDPPTASFLGHARALASASVRGTRAIGGASERSVGGSSGPVPVLLPAAAPTSGRFARSRAFVDSAAADALAARAREASATLDGLIAAAVSAVAGAVTGSPAQPIVATVLSRPRGHERVIGEYTSTVVLPSLDGPMAARARDFTGILVHAADRAHAGAADPATAAEGGPVPPIVYSSGLGSGGDQSEVLGAFGRTVDAISSTPQVLVDVQVFRRGGGLAVIVDHAADALQAGAGDAIAAGMAAALGAIADGALRLSDALVRPSSFLPDGASVLRPVDVSRGSFGTSAFTGTARIASPTAGASAPGSEPPEPCAGGAGGAARIERVITEGLGRILGTAIGVADRSCGFFDVGAASADLVRLRNHLVASGHELTLLDVFAHPSIAELAAFLAGAAPPPESTTEPARAPEPDPAVRAVAKPGGGVPSGAPLDAARLRGGSRRRNAIDLITANPATGSAPVPVNVTGTDMNGARR
ncbi:amino acid adenylation domain-containing protein [Corynebacterium freneyi]